MSYIHGGDNALPADGFMELRDIDLNLLILFESVYSTGNVGRAATRLGLTQPAASNGLARLRKLLDDPLFSRTPKGVVPTARAQQLIGPVREGLKALSAGLGGDGAIDLATYTRQFRLVMLDALEPILMPPIVRLITEQAPGISIEAITGDSDHVAEMRAGTLDMAVYSYPYDAPDIVTVSLGPADLVVIARRRHPGIGNRIDVAKLASLPYVALARSLRARTNVPKDLAAHALNRRMPYTVSKLYAMLPIVERTDLIAIVPRRFAEALEENYDIVIHELPVPIAEQYAHLMWHERNTGDPGHRWLREQLIAAAATTEPAAGRRRRVAATR